jgi:lipoprotein-anchoring transpeptidase ErfK/SrfK
VKYLLILLALFSTPALATTLRDGSILPAGQSVWISEDASAHLSVKVNLRSQMAYVYSGNTLVAASSVSSGRDGFGTSMGHFTILGKELNHHSKHYDADMPFTMWFNTSGEALHVGRVPGFRSSHGCVHLPADFAAKLYAKLKVGDSVTIADEAPQFSLNL